MTSSISPDYSPVSNHSYPSDLSIPSPTPLRQSRPVVGYAPPIRLSSPHLFRNIFGAETAGPSNHSPPRLPPLHGINYAETMQDVNRALQSANRAIQTAQEAFQSRNMPSSNATQRQDVVDLTHSPPTPPRNDRSHDSFLTRTLHPHDSRSNSWAASTSLNEPVYPRVDRSTNTQSLFVGEDDPTSLYAGQTDSLAGARRRYETQTASRRLPSFMTMPDMDRRPFMRPSMSAMQQRDDEDAIRRQRVARQQWEINQHRQRQRERLQQNRDRIIARTQPQGSTAQSGSRWPQAQSGRSTQNQGGSGIAIHQAPNLTTSPASRVETVDLTSVNDKTDLTAALLLSQASNRVAEPTSGSTEPRSALTGYKCPVCLEPPRNATTTICGHLFCHECILETLKHSENTRREDAPAHRKVKGQCPVCRKELARKEDEGPTRTLVPLEIKMISKKKLEELRQQERERKRQRDLEDEQNQSKGKGKEKAHSDADQQIFELSSDGEGDWATKQEDSQKENKAKRLKTSQSEERDIELFGEFTNDFMNDWQM